MIDFDQIKKLNKELHEFGKMVRIAEVRIKSFDRTNTQIYQDHAFMETLKEYIKNESECDTPREPSQEMLAKFAVKQGTENARVLAIFEDYFTLMK